MTKIEYITNVNGLRDASGFRPFNVCRITVIGKRGEFHGIRATYGEAVATAAHYERIFG